MTITSRLARAEANTRLAFSKADGAIAALPEAQIKRGSSLGNLIVSAAANVAFDPQGEALRISKTLEAEVDAALLEIEHARREGEHLRAIADYLAGRTQSLPDDVPTDLAAHAKSVKSASAAGLVDARAVAADIDRYSEAGRAEVKRLGETFVASTRSAVKVVAAKALKSAYSRAGLTKSAEVAGLRVVRLQAVHRSRFEYADRSRPRTAKRFPGGSK